MPPLLSYLEYMTALVGVPWGARPAPRRPAAALRHRAHARERRQPSTTSTLPVSTARMPGASMPHMLHGGSQGAGTDE